MAFVINIYLSRMLRRVGYEPDVEGIHGKPKYVSQVSLSYLVIIAP